MASRDARLAASAGGRHALRTRLTTRVQVTGRLTTRDGRPIPGAMLQVSARESAAGAATTLLGTAMTRGDGTFSYTVPPGPSRRIIVTYGAAPADARPVGTAAVRLLVPARVSFSVRPARPGRITWMRGRLRDLGRPGVQIQMQALDGRVWRTFDTTTTRRAGVFRFGYRFKPTAAGRTFQLRVLVDSPIYPFARAASPAVRIRVPG